MANAKFSAYEGPENYIFVSYAHKDSDKVFPIMEQLRSRGYRIWYDEGIAPGSEWPEDIARHLNGCSMAIAFVTPNSMASVNCRREINFALSKQKPFLSVILEPTEMPLGMELQLSAQQSVLRYNFRTEEQFIEKICACPDLLSCREYQNAPFAVPAAGNTWQPAPAYPQAAPQPPAAPSFQPPAAPEVPKAPPARKTGLIIGIAAAAAVLVIALILVLVFSGPKKNDTPSVNAPTSDAPTTENTAQAQEQVSGESQEELFTVHVRLHSSWQSGGLWAWQEVTGKEAFDSWPGEPLTAGADGWYTAQAPTWVNTVSITGNDGEFESAYVPVTGRDIWVIVREDYSCQYSEEGPFEATVTIHAQVPDNWADPCCWAWKNGGEDVFPAWPGGAFTRSGDWYTIELPAWADGIIVNSEAIGMQTGDLMVGAGWDIWVVVRDDVVVYFYYEPTEADIQAAITG